MNLQGKRVVVTGGAGFIGSHLVDALRAAGADAFPLDITTGFDIRYPHIIEPVIHGVDYVFHQAALYWRRCQENPRLCFEVMVDGTFNVLMAAQRAGVKHVVMASSAKVYGPPTFYSQAKLAGENLAKAFDVPVTILRYFNVYGPGQKDGVITNWLRCIERGQSLSVVAESTADFIHVDDVMRANLLALDGPSGTYDICSGTETQIADLAAMLVGVTASTVGIYRTWAETATRSVGNSFAAANALGFTAAIGLREGLEMMLDSDHQARAVVGRGASAS